MEYVICNTVYATYNYDLFVEDSTNRNINFESKRHKELYESIKSNELFIPIMVNKVGDKLLIVEGHHRYHACKENNKPIKFIIDNNFTLEKAIKCSATTKQWTVADLIEHGEKTDIPICYLLKEVCNKYPTFKTVGGVFSKAVRGYISYKEIKLDNKYLQIDELLKTEEGKKQLRSVDLSLFNELDSYIEKIYTLHEISLHSSHARINLTTPYIEGFGRAYKEDLYKNFPRVINNWTAICSKESNKLKDRERDICLRLTSRKAPLIREGLIRLI